MMHYYQELLEIDTQLGAKPEKIYKYYVYFRGGNILETFDKQEATIAQKDIGGVLESVIDNEQLIKDYNSYRSSLIEKLDEKWHKELREEYSHFDDAFYDLVYAKAYEDGHSYGYDEIANYMVNYAEFAENILNVSYKLKAKE